MSEFEFLGLNFSTDSESGKSIKASSALPQANEVSWPNLLRISHKPSEGSAEPVHFQSI